MLPFSRRFLRLNSVKILVANTNRTKFAGERICAAYFVRGKKSASGLHNLVKPVPVKPNPDDINAGEELSKNINKKDLVQVLNTFFTIPEIKKLAEENGIEGPMLKDAFLKFRKFCMTSDVLPTDLHLVIADILQGAGHHSNIFPYFLKHTREIFPHLECLDELKKVSDLRDPASWYPQARAKSRNIIFHSGPTNSGKTYHALERFITSKSGIYCGPLKLLAVEVFKKANARKTPCDLITGEDKQYIQANGEKANHVSCTVEMSPVNDEFEVAVIDEIQMIKDPQRGWAWTRALLGIVADEIHICGEEAAVELVRNLALATGDSFEVKRYSRLTKLEIEEKAVEHLNNVRDGDCIVCFNKGDIYSVSQSLQNIGKEVAVIYGSLPPGAKNMQCQRFNDPDDPCKVLVATDAIGMGLNLSIGRIIFYSLKKKNMNDKGEIEFSTISVSQALQIAGRAGRFGTKYEIGYVTTFKRRDLSTLKSLLSKMPDEICQAGLHPTADQIELYAYFLPNSSFFDLLDIFVSLSTLDDSLYFICDLTSFKTNAEIIEHVPLSLRSRYIFCCSPIDHKRPFITSMFLKIARRYSSNNVITFNWLAKQVGWPLKSPQNVVELVHCENMFDVLDLYLWLSYRFPDYFPHTDLVKEVQFELDNTIREGIVNLVTLIKNSSKLPGDTLALPKMKALLSEEDTEKEKEESRLASMPGMEKPKLSDRLVKEGLLTPMMLEQLRKEWMKSIDKFEEVDEE